MPGKKYITANEIFTGHDWLADHAIIIENKLIADIVPLSELPSDAAVENFKENILAPAFIDLQIYGAGGKLLAEFPNTDSLKVLVEYCAEGGAAWCLPTVATNEYDVFYRCIDAIREYWKTGGEGVLGLHIEGPWINPKKRGAHIESLVHSPSLSQVTQLLEYGKGVIKMITLAPEVCSNDVIEMVRREGIIISAGHSDATYEEAIRAFDKGINLATHLYNAMSPLGHRAPGLVGACFNDDRVNASIIPDGYHVDFSAISIAKKIMGERLFAITDAVTETNTGYYPHQFAGDKYESGGVLSGSALNMMKAFMNLVMKVGVERGEAIRMCGLYPANVIGLQSELGKLRKGFQAAIVVINEKTGEATLLQHT